MDWHDDDEFWETFEPFMFNEQRLAATPYEVDQLLNLLNLIPGAEILDLGCGVGRHSLELARRGYRVTGVDRTARFLESAQNEAKGEGLNIEFVKGDMRSFRRLETFDCVLSLFTTFGYFENQADNMLVLANVYESLNRGGAFLLELMGKEVLARIFCERDWEEWNGLYHLQERRVSKNWSWMENRWILVKEGKIMEHKISHWLYSAQELIQILKEIGFENINTYGGLDGAAYDHMAKRLVLSAQK